MPLFRYALARLCLGLLALALFALLMNALILSHQLRLESAAALASPPPRAMPLATVSGDTPADEVHVLARIDATLDVALPAGTGRLVLLSDPAAPPAAPAMAAILLSPRERAAFETMLARTGTKADGATTIALNGLRETPYWIDHAALAAKDTNRALAADVMFIRPFLSTRAAGLAPSPMTFIVPAVLAALLAALLWSEARVIRLRRRALSAMDSLAAIDLRTESLAARIVGANSGGSTWAEVATQRQALRKDRARLDATIAKAGRAGRFNPTLFVPVGVAVVGVAAIVPHRPLLDAVSTYLVGTDLHAIAMRALASDNAFSRWADLATTALTLPADGLAAFVLNLLGPQSVGMAEVIRSSSVVVWTIAVALLILAMVRRIDDRSDG